MEVEHESRMQKQCPTCHTVFCNGASNCAHFAKEREYLAYSMITGINMPTQWNAMDLMLMTKHKRWVDGG